MVTPTVNTVTAITAQVVGHSHPERFTLWHHNDVPRFQDKVSSFSLSAEEFLVAHRNSNLMRSAVTVCFGRDDLHFVF